MHKSVNVPPTSTPILKPMHSPSLINRFHIRVEEVKLTGSSGSLRFKVNIPGGHEILKRKAHALKQSQLFRRSVFIALKNLAQVMLYVSVRYTALLQGNNKVASFKDAGTP